MDKEKDDGDEVKFEVSMAEDKTEWNIRVLCDKGLNEHELGVALHSLGDDLLQDKISFDSAPDVDILDPDLH